MGLYCQIDLPADFRVPLQHPPILPRLISGELESYPANKKQTIGEQKREKRRPHISLLDLFVTPNDLKPDVVFDIVAREIIEDNRG